MVKAYRLLAERGDWPLHLGVTEAGPAFQGTIKSATAFGILLSEGIGDTIRVSLSAPPVEEVKVGLQILQSLNLRERKLEIVSCPSCGRAQVDVYTLADDVTAGLEGMTVPLRVAVMGCVVNGPGEAREADLGVASGNGKGQIFVKGEVIKTVPESEIVATLIEEAKRLAAEMGEPDGRGDCRRAVGHRRLTGAPARVGSASPAQDACCTVSAGAAGRPLGIGGGRATSAPRLTGCCAPVTRSTRCRPRTATPRWRCARATCRPTSSSPPGSSRVCCSTQPGTVLGHKVGGSLESLCWSSANLVPVEADEETIAFFADRVRRWRRHCASILGPADQVIELWRHLAPAWGPARAVRADQPLMSTMDRPSALGVELDPRVRPAREHEVDLVMPGGRAHVRGRDRLPALHRVRRGIPVGACWPSSTAGTRSSPSRTVR